MSMDTTLEPIALIQGYWAYRRDDPLRRLGPRWLGAPLVNLMAWSCLQGGYSYGIRCRLKPIVQLGVGVGLCLLGFGVLGAVRLVTGNADWALASLAAISVAFFCLQLRPSLIASTGQDAWHQLLLRSIPVLWHIWLLGSLSWLPDDAAMRASGTATTLAACGVLSTLLFQLQLAERDPPVTGPGPKRA